MKDPYITDQDIKTRLKKTKNRKAAGPDGIKIELFKVMIDSSICMRNLRVCLNNTLNSGKHSKPKGWETSKTKMMKKKKKPTVEDLRPIALLNSSYKVFMGIMKTKIEEHLKENNAVNYLQAGFTSGRRATDNMFIMNYCIEESFTRKKPLIAIFIDFSKAFDSIKREKLVETLMKYKVHH